MKKSMNFSKRVVALKNGKERIYSFFKEHYNTQERAEFLAKNTVLVANMQTA